MKMPFGKYKGQEVADIPRPYLVWALDNIKIYGGLYQEMREAAYGDSKPATPDVDGLLDSIIKPFDKP